MQYTPYALPMLFSAPVHLGLAIYAWRRARQVHGAFAFGFAMLMASFWALESALEVLSTTLDGKVFWMSVRPPFIELLVVALFVMATQYTGLVRSWRWWWLAALLVMPAILAALSLTTTQHTLYRYDYRLYTAGPFPTLLFQNGLGYMLQAAYGYILVIPAVVLLAWPLRSFRGLYFRQNLWLVAGIVLPLLLNAAFDVGLSPVRGYNPGPASFAVSGSIMAWALFRYRVFDVVPIARSHVVNSMSDLMLVLDAQGRLVDFNPAAKKAIGLDPTKAIGQPVENVVDRWPGLVRRYGSVLSAQDRVSMGEGEGRRVYDLSISPIYDGRGRFLGRLVLLHEVTEMERAKEAAMAATRAKSLFLANMSHEIRTPMTVILGYAQLLSHDTNLTPMQQERLAHIRRGGDHLLALLNDILDMSKIEAGRMVLQPRPFDLHSLLTTLAELFRQQAEARGLALQVEWDGDVPRHVKCDEAKLRQVLVNLVGNAIKFTDKGSVSVRVRVLPREEATSRRVQFSVEDTGVGIDPQEMAALFEPFQQTESGRRLQQGTGLGLALSHQMVRLMGGEMTASSAEARGSCFQFDVPMMVIAGEGSQLPAHARQGRVMGVAPGQPLRRVLVVDDEPSGRQLLLSLLSHLNGGGAGEPALEMREAADGREAVDVWENWQPHLILMDMRMPLLSGEGATREIKARMCARPDAVSSIVVAVSASAFAEDRASFLACGCDDFVSKPLGEEQLAELLFRHLSVHFIYSPPLQEDDSAALGLGEVAQRLAACPRAWLFDLRYAIELGDFERVAVLIEVVRPNDAGLAARLDGWAHNYDQDALLRLVHLAEAAA